MPHCRHFRQWPGREPETEPQISLKPVRICQLNQASCAPGRLLCDLLPVCLLLLLSSPSRRLPIRSNSSPYFKFLYSIRCCFILLFLSLPGFLLIFYSPLTASLQKKERPSAAHRQKCLPASGAPSPAVYCRLVLSSIFSKAASSWPLSERLRGTLSAVWLPLRNM